MKQKIVSRIAEGAFRYQAWPTLAKAQDGTLFIGASGHRLGHVCPLGKTISTNAVFCGGKDPA